MRLPIWLIGLLLVVPSYAVKAPGPTAKCLQLLVRQPQLTTVAFRLLRTPRVLRELLSLPGDRLLLRMANRLQDLNMNLLSFAGRKAVERYLENPPVEALLNQLAGEFGVDADQARVMLQVDGHRWIGEMFEARHQQDWGRMIDIFQQELRGPWGEVPEAQLQMALALNRRNLGEDRQKALAIADRVLAATVARGQTNLLGEASGIRARIFKDLYDETGDPRHLDEAIRTYLAGFNLNPMDYYPGIAGLNLLGVRNAPGDSQLMARYLSRIQRAVDTSLDRYKEQGNHPDYWLLATQMRLQALGDRWDLVGQTLPLVLMTSLGSQNIQTTLADYKRTYQSWQADPEKRQSADRLLGLIHILERVLAYPQSLQGLSAYSPSYISTEAFSETEGIFSTAPFHLLEQIQKSGIESDLRAAATRMQVDVMSFHRFLQLNTDATHPPSGILLGRTGPYRAILQEIANLVHLDPWWVAFHKKGIVQSVRNTRGLLERALQDEEDIYLLVPDNFTTEHSNSFTYSDFRSVMELMPEHNKHIHFVFGVQRVYPMDFTRRIVPSSSTQIVSKRYATGVLREFNRKFRNWLVSLGPSVREYSFRLAFDNSLYPLVYDQVLGRLSFHRHLRELHVKAMPAHGRVFDIGGGTGLIARELQNNRPQLVVDLFDPSDLMTSVAITQGIDPTNVHASGGEDLKWKGQDRVNEATADGAVSSNVMYLLSHEQIERTFAEVRRVLKKGAPFSVSSMLEVELPEHQAFLAAMDREAQELERQGMIPVGASTILLSSNAQLVNNQPTFLTVGQITAIAQRHGFRVRQQATTVYMGTGFFIVFEKL